MLCHLPKAVHISRPKRGVTMKDEILFAEHVWRSVPQHMLKSCTRHIHGAITSFLRWALYVRRTELSSQSRVNFSKGGFYANVRDTWSRYGSRLCYPKTASTSEGWPSGGSRSASLLHTLTPAFITCPGEGGE